ncbi:MAG: hypothetical protein FWC09_04780 [Lachnospiraceae bacterium]|nr:hypothetical protein [Lachnospiraceae bacterium]
MSFETEIINIMEKDRNGSTADFNHINKLIKEFDLSYRNICVRTLAVPKVLSEKQYDEIGGFITKLYSIFDKVIEKYFSDADYRKLFGFAPKLEELILSSHRRNGYIPMARIDFFLDEEKGAITMCEINTDGTSAMNEDRLLGEFLEHNSAFQTFAKDKPYRRFELFDSWAVEFLTVYQAFLDEKDKASVQQEKNLPRVAIVDFLDVGYVTEFEQFMKTFIRHGMETEICDIRDLIYNGKVLTTKSGMVIDAIYRRAVTSDIMKHYDEVTPFLNAVRDGAVCLIGDFVTQIVHNKRLFFILYHQATKDILSAEEYCFIEKHFPATFSLTSENISLNNVNENREQWIIKPCDSYGAKGFYAGKNCSLEDWQKALNDHLKEDYVLQKFNQPYKTPNIDYSLAEPIVRDYSNLTGIFCYNGKPYGAYSRMADGDIISTQYDEKTIATVIV